MKKLITTLSLALGLAVVGATDVSAYTVKSGDTLSEIASDHGKDLQTIIEANPHIEDPHWIFPNQYIHIPSVDEKRSTAVKKTVTTERISLNTNESDLLARLVRAEAEGEPYAGKVAVATVVLNRVLDERFPNTVEGVIYQSGQFTPVSNGRIYRPSTQEDREAVNEAVHFVNSGQTDGSLFFYNYHIVNNSWFESRQTVKFIGNHVFKK